MRPLLKLALLVIIVTLYSCNSHNTYKLKVGNADGLYKGAAIKMSGLEIGTVGDIGVKDGGAIIALLNISNEVPIPVNSKFYVKSSDLSGTKEIQLVAGSSIELLNPDSVPEATIVPASHVPY